MSFFRWVFWRIFAKMMKWFSLGQFRDSRMVFRCPTAQHNYTRCSRKGGCWQPCHGGIVLTRPRCTWQRIVRKKMRRKGWGHRNYARSLSVVTKKGELLTLLTNVPSKGAFESINYFFPVVIGVICDFPGTRSRPPILDWLDPILKTCGHLIRWRKIYENMVNG